MLKLQSHYQVSVTLGDKMQRWSEAAQRLDFIGGIRTQTTLQNPKILADAPSGKENMGKLNGCRCEGGVVVVDVI
jgi:hypothetical protein